MSYVLQVFEINSTTGKSDAKEITIVITIHPILEGTVPNVMVIHP